MNELKSWNISNRFDKQVRSINNIHNQAREKFEMLTKPKKLIQSAFEQQSTKAQKEYHTRLLTSLHFIRSLLHQGLPTRGHDESQESSNKGNFLNFLNGQQNIMRKLIKLY